MTLLFDNVKRYSKLRGWNLQTTAERAGLSKNALYKWNKDDFKPSEQTQKAVADALNITYEQLTGQKQESKPITVDLKASIEDEDVIMTYDGKPIPEEDLALIKRLMRGE